MLSTSKRYCSACFVRHLPKSLETRNMLTSIFATCYLLFFVEVCEKSKCPVFSVPFSQKANDIQKNFVGLIHGRWSVHNEFLEIKTCILYFTCNNLRFCGEPFHHYKMGETYVEKRARERESKKRKWSADIYDVWTWLRQPRKIVTCWRNGGDFERRITHHRK